MRFLDLRRMVVAEVDLPSYIELEAGVDMISVSGEEGKKCLCPLHGDTDPSFSLLLHDDGWGYNCFGCGAKGTVVEFFMDYHGIETVGEALEAICEHFELKDESELVKRAVESLGKNEFNDKKRLAMIHEMASHHCRLLLKSKGDDPDVAKWVRSSYAQMNRSIMGKGDYALLEMIYDRATEQMDW